jgi:chorismate synthase
LEGSYLSGTWGRNIKYTIFGESHGEGIGIVIDNLPPGLELNTSKINSELQRRQPGTDSLTTARKEADEFEILSGIFNNRTTGAPLCSFIKNSDQQLKDYEQTKHLIRPGHADYTGYVKYKGFNDYRGGGHFSGRLTAAIVFAGAIAKQILLEQNISIISHIYKIGNLCDATFRSRDLSTEDYSHFTSMLFPTIDASIGIAMQQKVSEIKALGDSIGGIVETAVLNLPPGLGSPFFDSLESTISHLIFSIPGVKGIEFGDGFDLSEMQGSVANDQFYLEDSKIKTHTNHNGGILGGISTGMPLIFNTAFKPTPSIALEQNTIDMKQMQNTTLKIIGRHDPCIVPRALPVVEAVAAMAILDCLTLSY